MFLCGGFFDYLSPRITGICAYWGQQTTDYGLRTTDYGQRSHPDGSLLTFILSTWLHGNYTDFYAPQGKPWNLWNLLTRKKIINVITRIKLFFWQKNRRDISYVLLFLCLKLYVSTYHVYLRVIFIYQRDYTDYTVLPRDTCDTWRDGDYHSNVIICLWAEKIVILQAKKNNGERLTVNGERLTGNG